MRGVSTNQQHKRKREKLQIEAVIGVPQKAVRNRQVAQAFIMREPIEAEPLVKPGDQGGLVGATEAGGRIGDERQQRREQAFGGQRAGRRQSWILTCLRAQHCNGQHDAQDADPALPSRNADVHAAPAQAQKCQERRKGHDDASHLRQPLEAFPVEGMEVPPKVDVAIAGGV